MLAGFWSKDEIIHAAFIQSPLLGFVALLTAVLTAFYTFRMIFRAFHGVTRIPEGVRAHESGPWMIGPLVVLSIGAVFAGYVGVEVGHGGWIGMFQPHGAFHHFLEPVTLPFTALHDEVVVVGHWQAYGLMYSSAALAVFGIMIAYFLYLDSPMLALLLRRGFPRTHKVLSNKYYVDEAYSRCIVEPARRVGKLCFAIDQYFIDGIVWLVTAVPRLLALILRTLQNGTLQGYGTSMVLGLAALLVFVLMGALS